MPIENWIFFGLGIVGFFTASVTACDGKEGRAFWVALGAAIFLACAFWDHLMAGKF